MNIPNKTNLDGFTLPVYGLGTWQMGGRSEPDVSRDAIEIEAIKNAINQGVRHIDTAESYANGHTEILIGQAIKHYDREKLIIASKVSAWNQTYDGVIKAFNNCIDRLNTDYLDLYLLHRYPEPGIDITETMKAMDHLVDIGKVKNIGVCNMTIPMIESVQRQSKHKIVCNQVHYSLECREIIDKGILEYCQNHNILVTAWGPLSKGNLNIAPILIKLAEKYSKTPYQIALNWLTSQNLVVVIPKTSNPQHLKENLEFLNLSLAEEDMVELTNNYPNQKLISDRVPLNYEVEIK